MEELKILNIEEFHNHVLSCYPQEACGYIEDGVFTPVENTHEDPLNYFKFPLDVDSSLLSKTSYAIIHSHTPESFKDDPRIPSYEDMLGQRNSAVPWGIVHSDGENVSEVLWFGKPNIAPLEGRVYISNVQDCFTLARDYIYRTTGRDVGTHPRPANWETWNPHYIERTYKDLGYVDTTVLQTGTVLLFSIGSKYINHIGIYLGGDKFIHHLYNRRSAEDSLLKWKRQLIKAIRYKDDN